MTTTDTSEKGLESLIVAAMAGEPARAVATGGVGEASALYGGTGWLLGQWQDYDREYAVDLAQLHAFLEATQSAVAAAVNPEFDVKRAQKKLRRYVEGHDYAVRLKAEIMIDHFHEQVIGLHKVGGQARAMVVTSGIERAITYYHAIRVCVDVRVRTRPSFR